MRRLKPPFLILILVIATLASATLPQTVSAQTYDAQRAERVLDMAEKARVKVDAIFTLADQKNVTIPEDSLDARRQGDALMDQAQAAYAAGNYTLSMRLALRAMHNYKLAVSPLAVLLDESDLGVPPPNARTREAIRQKALFLSKVHLILERAQAKGLAVANIESRLRLAEGHLNNVTALLDEGEVDAAAQELGKVRSSFAGVMDDLQHLAKEHNRQRIQSFANSQKQLLHSLEKSVALAERRRLDVANATASIEEAKDTLEEAKSLAEQGEITSAIMKLKEARKETQNAFKDLHPRGWQNGLANPSLRSRNIPAFHRP